MNQKSGSSDLNAGSTTSDVGGGSDTAIYTSTGGNFDGTSVFTPTDGSTPASTVSAGMYASLYNTGDTTGRYVAQVTAVGAGVNGTITVSTTIKYGTAPTSNSGSRACKIGGAIASFANVPLTASQTAPQSTRINIKAATYANTTTGRTVSLNGSATVGVWFRGYQTTPGDQDTTVAMAIAVAGTNIPLVTFTTGQFIAGTHQKYSSLAFTSASTSSFGTFTSSQTTTLVGLQLSNTAANSVGYALRSVGVAVNCLISVTTTANAAVPTINSGAVFDGCQISGGIVGIIIGSAQGVTVKNATFYGQAGDATTWASSSWGSIINCSFYAPIGNAINVTGAIAAPLYISNCYFSTVNQASKAAINNTSGTNTDLIIPTGNAYFNCTSNTSGITENFLIFDNGTLASEAFKNPTGSPPDFSILPVGQGIGFPGAFAGTSTYQGYLDVGAVQHKGTGANLSRVFSGF